MERRLPPGLQPWRALLSLLLAFFLVGSAVELHPGEEAHGEEAAGLATLFVPSASHPEQGKHMESAGEASSRHRCAACLHNLQTAGLYLATSAHTAPRLAGEGVLLAHVDRPSGLSRLPNGARAPPRA